MDTAKVAEKLVSWLKEQVESSGGKGAVFGLSGGIDSAVVAALCREAFGKNCLAVIMPCHSNPQDKQDALEIVRSLDLPYREVVLDDVFDAILRSIKGSIKEDQMNTMAAINLKPRLRMCVLYYLAAQRSYRVIGTGNKSEIYIGYFTKHGDAGVDLEPIGELLKEEVKQLAQYFAIPQKIINKNPSAGLWEGQTDEEELGFTYAQLDRYIRSGEAEPNIKKRIDEMHQRSAHKRAMPPTCPLS